MMSYSVDPAKMPLGRLSLAQVGSLLVTGGVLISYMWEGPCLHGVQREACALFTPPRPGHIMAPYLASGPALLPDPATWRLPFP